jgi:uncharacterized protein
MPDHTAAVLPRMHGLTADFYRWLAKGELRFQECSECKVMRHVPRVLCPSCSSDRFEWKRSSGRGTIFSWTTTARSLHPGFTKVPMTLAIVAMEEGPRLLAQLIDVTDDEIEEGIPVTASIDSVTDDIGRVRFRPVEEAVRTVDVNAKRS